VSNQVPEAYLIIKVQDGRWRKHELVINQYSEYTLHSEIGLGRDLVSVLSCALSIRMVICIFTSLLSPLFTSTVA
jgi:hypothetical protein